MSEKRASLVVLISGSGSNLQAIINAVNNGEINADIKAVISNRAGVKGLQLAEQAGIKTFTLNHTDYNSREIFDLALIECIDQFTPSLVILAGFMRILSDVFINHYSQRLLNIHPSLLPKYKGLNTHERALNAGDAMHGASVHMVNAELDSGEIVIQAEVDIKPDDNEESLAKRVLTQEHKIYPLTISLFVDGTLHFEQHVLQFNNKPLLQPLLWTSNKLLTQ